MTVNALFLISPAYSVPTMMTSIRWRWTRIAVSVRVPSVAGSALNDGMQMIVKFGLERREVLGARPAEQVAREHAGPGRLGVDAQRAPVARVGADEAVLGVQVAVRAVGDEPGAQPVVVRLADRPVDRAPPDVVAARRLVDDELVLGRTAGVPPGPDDERPLGGDQALAVADRVLDELGASGRWRARSGRGRDGRRRTVGGHRGSDSSARAITVTDRPAARDARRGERESASTVAFRPTLPRCGRVSPRLRDGAGARRRRTGRRAAEPVSAPLVRPRHEWVRATPRTGPSSPVDRDLRRAPSLAARV